ncbi:MAG: hypothetical protein DSY46_02355 [Hydrogenimonas sp.]|nr:MAG: hypothetical protein DSY46_02355 [Hydrogenimonas sp.]
MKLSMRFVLWTMVLMLIFYILAEVANYYSGLKKYEASLLETDKDDLALLLRLKKEHLRLLAIMLANDKDVLDAYLHDDPTIIQNSLKSFWELATTQKMLYEIHFFKPPAQNFFNFTHADIEPYRTNSVRRDIVWVTSTFQPSDHLMVCRNYAGVRSTYPIFSESGVLLGGLSLGAKLEWIPEFLGEMLHAPVFLTYRLDTLRYLSPEAYRHYVRLGKSWKDWLVGAKTEGIEDDIVKEVDFSKPLQRVFYQGKEYFLTLQPLVGFRGEEIGRVGVLHTLESYYQNFFSSISLHALIVFVSLSLFALFMYSMTRHLKRRIESVYQLSEAFRNRRFEVVEQVKLDQGNDEISRIKNDLIELGRTLKRYYTQLQDMVERRTQELKMVRSELESQMLIDPELKIPNRIALEQDLKSVQGAKLALIDIYRFKSINDTYGVDVGNHILMELVRRLKEMIDACGEGLKLYRSGSDEFVLLDVSQKSDEFFVICVKSIVADIEAQSFTFDDLGVDLSVEMHAGISLSDQFLLEEADIAVNEAEKRHEDVYVYDKKPQQREEQRRNIEMLKAVRMAIQADHITPYYQPIVDRDGKIVKFEALVRMIDRHGKIVPPGAFLEVVKNSKFYHALTRIVIQKSFETFESLPYTISVNLSIVDLLNRETMEMIAEAVKAFPDPERIVFELLESESMEGYEETHRFVEMVRSLGANIAIDDFGTGYSNFSYLASLQPDCIKIDGSLIKELPTNEKSYQIVKSIVEFSKALDVNTVAEFVSDQAIFESARELGIDQFQGFYFGKPEASPHIERDL